MKQATTKYTKHNENQINSHWKKNYEHSHEQNVMKLKSQLTLSWQETEWVYSTVASTSSQSLSFKSTVRQVQTVAWSTISTLKRKVDTAFYCM